MFMPETLAFDLSFIYLKFPNALPKSTVQSPMAFVLRAISVMKEAL